MSIPTGAIGIVTLLIGIWLTNRYKTRWAVLVVITLFPIGGIAAMCNVSRDNTGGLMASFYIAYALAGIREWMNVTGFACADDPRRTFVVQLGWSERSGND